jgi:periplasmic divalent cation tolerance protein
MLENQKYLLVLTTVANSQQANQLATLLVKHKLAACVNILPQLSSVYEWQDQLVQTEEFLLLIKTLNSKYQAVENMLKHHHPYTLPEIVGLPITKGSDNYLAWLGSTLE